MRQIKFRAWHKPTQLMDDVVLIDFYNEKIGILYADPVMQCESIQKYNFSEVEIMQSTGLHDKNGVEIYEGDVLEFTVWDAWDNDTQYIGVVKFEQGEWQIWNSEQSEFYDADGAFNLFWVHENDTEIKVIGNIHENPELLEAER